MKRLARRGCGSISLTHCEPNFPPDGTAIVPGDLAASSLVERIIADDDSLKMPPPESGKTLSAEEIELLQKWVEQGAVHVPHWAYAKPIRPPVPSIEGTLLANPIDAFVRKSLADHGLAPAPAASRERLIRRMTFDLIGLPPTLAEIDAFMADESPDATRNLSIG